MFGFSKTETKYDELVEKYDATAIELKHALAELETYKTWWKEVHSDQRDSESIIDWKGIDAVTIERSPNGSHPSTIIGFKKVTSTVNADGSLTSETGIKEWYLHCSQPRHDELVAEFKAYLKNK